jgi:hypothetical protein
MCHGVAVNGWERPPEPGVAFEIAREFRVKCGKGRGYIETPA